MRFLRSCYQSKFIFLPRFSLSLGSFTTNLQGHERHMFDVIFARNLKLPTIASLYYRSGCFVQISIFMLLFLLITLFSCQVLFIQQCYLYMASHDAKSLIPRKWMSEEQKLFSPPLGFVLYNWECFANTCSYTKLQEELNRDYKSG